MSASIGTVRALLLAVRDRVRTVCSLSADECEVMPSGEPPAKCGERFVAIHPGGITLDSPEFEFWDANVSVKASVTARAGRVPADRAGTHLVSAEDGLTDLAEMVAKSVHGSYTVLDTANATLGVGTQPFNEPLRCTGGIPEPRKQGPAWFSSDAKQVVAAGWSIEVKWSGGRRPEVLPDASED